MFKPMDLLIDSRVFFDQWLMLALFSWIESTFGCFVGQFGLAAANPYTPLLEGWQENFFLVGLSH